MTRYLILFFFNDTATTEIYTLSLHDALPISPVRRLECAAAAADARRGLRTHGPAQRRPGDPLRAAAWHGPGDRQPKPRPLRRGRQLRDGLPPAPAPQRPHRPRGAAPALGAAPRR